MLTARVAASLEAPQFRADVQGLRAIAVSAVLAFHLWPANLRGGYVGVDVFFVISGFLIGGQLLREIDKTGRLDLIAFWARRIKRLQPAALLVLCAIVPCIFILVPRGLWLGWLQEIAASALWTQNWLLGFNAVDYLAASNEPSPTQHYWTLSVEEQFYLGFPLLLTGLVWLAGKRHLAQGRSIASGLFAVAVVSFLFSLWQTYVSPSMAYFSTFTRAWEFASGALLAMMKFSPPKDFRNPVIALGLALLIASARIYSSDTPIPGIAALVPVAGALLCLWAGRDSILETFGRFRPVAILGHCSYAIYLWHWPLIVLTPWAFMHVGLDLAWPYGRSLLIAASSVLLGWFSTRYVEEPIRFSPKLLGGDHRKWMVLTSFVAALALLLICLAVPLQAERNRQEIIAHHLSRIRALPIDDLPACLGAAAMDRKHEDDGCHNPQLDGVLLPDLAVIREDDANRGQCWNTGAGAFRICNVGPRSRHVRRILAIGDSHNLSLLDAYQYIATKNNWRIDVSGYGGCYLSTAAPAIPSRHACSKWRDFVVSQAMMHRYDAYIFTHSRTTSPVSPRLGETQEQTVIDGLVAAWRELPKATIIALVDNPGTGKGRRIVSCYMKEASRHGDIRTACSWTRSEALRSDGLKEAATLVDNAHAIDLTDFYCNQTTCPAVIGNVIVYRDDNHITRTWSKTLAPYLNQEVVALVEGTPPEGAP